MFGQYSKSFQFRITELCRKSSRSYDFMTKHGWLNSGKVRNYKRIRFKVSLKIEVYQGRLGISRLIFNAEWYWLLIAILRKQT